MKASAAEKARLKKITVSSTLPATLDTNGARHQLPARSRLNTATSSSWPTRNAVAEPIATRRLTSGPNGPSIC